MTVAVSGESITFADSSVQNTAATGFGFKNRIINGAMVIDQRNAGAAITLTSGAQYCPDRYQIRTASGSSNTAQTQTTTVPNGFNNALKITIGTGASPGANENNFIAQSIEGYNVADLNFGSSNAQTFTASFWVRSSVTGTYGLSFSNNAGDRAYVTSYTVNSANTWEYKTITVAGDTTGTWDKTNNVGIQICWDIGQGSTRSFAASTSWQANNALGLTGGVKLVATSGATFYITGVQLEKGSTATSFDYRPYGTELALCQRYLYAIRGSLALSNQASVGVGCWDGTSGAIIFVPFPVQLRTYPSSITVSSVSDFQCVREAVAWENATAITLTADGAGVQAASITVSTATRDSRGFTARMRSNASGAYLGFNAEL
jgi:hypothetical protein